MKKVLILPELFDEVHTWWPMSVVANMNKYDNKKHFTFIYKWGVIERDSHVNPLKKFLKKWWFLTFLNYIFYIFAISKKIRKSIVGADEIISHEVFYSFCSIFFLKQKKVSTIIHSQGNVYNEVINLWGSGRSLILKKFLDFVEFFTIKNSKIVGFPSKWAFDWFYKTSSERVQNILRAYNLEGKIKIFYNWIELNQKKSNKNIFNIQWNNEKIIFTTVSTLNEEKWVDRIPCFLQNLKKKNINFEWYLVWNWKFLSKIQDDIKKYNLSESVKIHSTGLPKEDIIDLFKRSDFYIMFHRLSVFDYATLEAMNEWCIPLLSKIGGNKEVILSENGFLIDDEQISQKNFEELINFILSCDKKDLKQKNKDIIKNNFSNNNFIEWYYSIL